MEENIGITLFDINHRKIPFDSPLIVMELKTKTNKWDLFKLKSFCIQKLFLIFLFYQPIKKNPRVALYSTDAARRLYTRKASQKII